MDKDVYYLKRAIKLAEKGRWKTGPNPMVGAVIVKNGKITAEGYHKGPGGKHAEADALEKAGAGARGAELYTNLEPCVHHGRTPPCTDAIIKSGVSRVVSCMKDPNPLVSGAGFKKLSRAGIIVKRGILEKEAAALNEAYIKYITRRMPFVIIKAAMTLDGKIATRTGRSRWISSEESRLFVHKIRSKVDAVMVGAGTVAADNPSLSARGIRNARQPVRIIVGARGKIPPGSKVLTVEPERTIIASAIDSGGFEKNGVEIIAAGSRNGKVKLKPLMKMLPGRGIYTVLIEGGGQIIASAIRERIADRVLFFYAPKIFGGSCAPTAVEGHGISSPDRAVLVTGIKLRRLGGDILVDGQLQYPGRD